MTRGRAFVAGSIAGAVATALAFTILLPPASTEQDTPNLTPRRSMPQAVVAHSMPEKTAGVAIQAPLPTVDTPAAPLRMRNTHRPVPSLSKRADTPVAEQALPPESDAAWQALVGGVLEHEVAHRYGRQLDPVQQQRLLDKLAQLRYASLGLQEEPADSADPAALRLRLSRTLAIVQADQAFREALGIGVAEFLQGLDADAIEDVAPARANR